MIKKLFLNRFLLDLKIFTNYSDLFVFTQKKLQLLRHYFCNLFVIICHSKIAKNDDVKSGFLSFGQKHKKMYGNK
jgi:hypothetical protein